LGVDIVHELIGRPTVSTDHLCQRFVALAAVVELQSGKQHAFRVDIADVDDQARSSRTNIDVVCGVAGERHQLAFMEDRDDDREIRGMAGPVIRMVMHYHVAFVPGTALERGFNASQISRNRANVHWRGLRLTERLVF
jgi:hypothetical protein